MVRGFCALLALLLSVPFLSFFLFQCINLMCVYQSIFVISVKQFFLKYLIAAEARKGFHTVL